MDWNVGSGKFIVKIRYKITLWQAIKIRIAGKSYEKMIEPIAAALAKCGGGK